jgi:hypothetical protein
MLLFNCSEANRTTFLDINISSDNNNLVDVNIPTAIGNPVIANSINSDIEKLVIDALLITKQNNYNYIEVKTIEEGITTFNQEYEAFKADFPESSQIWEAQIDGEVLFQSPEITTISLTSYINTGGAHGILNISFLNFNSRTGKRISNKNLFSDIEGFRTLAKTYFKKAIKEDDVIFNQDKFELPTNIGYSEDGLVLLYNTYEIAPYSTGIIEFAIPFKNIASYLVFNSAD